MSDKHWSFRFRRNQWFGTYKLIVEIECYTESDARYVAGELDLALRGINRDMQEPSCATHVHTEDVAVWDEDEPYSLDILLEALEEIMDPA